MSQQTLAIPAFCDTCALAITRTDSAGKAALNMSLDMFSFWADEFGKDPRSNINFHFCKKTFVIEGVTYSCKCGQHKED